MLVIELCCTQQGVFTFNGKQTAGHAQNQQCHMCLPQEILYEVSLSTTGITCLPQEMLVYHRESVSTVNVCVPQRVFVHHRECLSTAAHACLPQGMSVYHRECLSTTWHVCLPQGMLVYHRACLSTTGHVCLPQGMLSTTGHVCVYVMLLCMVTNLLPCLLARRRHQWTGTAGSACSEGCQAEAWPAGIPLGCRSADTRAALPHHHAAAEAAPEPGGCIITGQQIHPCIRSLTCTVTRSCISSGDD